MPQNPGNIPYMPLGMKVPPELMKWMGSAEYKKFNDRVNKMLSKRSSVLGNYARYNRVTYRLGSP